MASFPEPIFTFFIFFSAKGETWFRVLFDFDDNFELHEFFRHAPFRLLDPLDPPFSLLPPVAPLYGDNEQEWIAGTERGARREKAHKVDTLTLTIELTF